LTFGWVGRLILSGTPIQNNVLELWSLFDFLLPGYLGKEVRESRSRPRRSNHVLVQDQFQKRFGKPISLAARCSVLLSLPQSTHSLDMLQPRGRGQGRHRHPQAVQAGRR
jgi:SNF2 family DNA or RNA helicase